LARLGIDWKTQNTVAVQAAETGDESEAAAPAKPTAALFAERPMWVFVMADDATNATMRKLEDVVFKNEDVGVGSKFLACIKVSEADASRDRILKEAGRGTPRMILLRRDYSVHSVLNSDQMSAGKLLKVMKSLVGENYKSSFDGVVSEYKKLLNELDRLDSVRTNLETKRQKADGPADLKKIERDQQEYEKDMAAWTEKEQKLLQFQKKGEKSETPGGAS
jgi:hypothetical protein